MTSSPSSDEEQLASAAQSSPSSSSSIEQPQPQSSIKRRRKLRVLVITMGGTRQRYMEEIFQHPTMVEQFEPPIFSLGVSSRQLRNRYEFFNVANDAGLLPQAEWDAIHAQHVSGKYATQYTEKFLDCLEGIPITTEGRQGSRDDLKLHYSEELWRKAKTLNRGRAVLGCTFAHLIALKKFVSEDFDMILEDNVRTCPDNCAQRIWNFIDTSFEWENEQQSLEKQDEGHGDNDGSTTSRDTQCHFRFFGWLGSVPNLKWILNVHSKKRGYCVRDPQSSPTPDHSNDNVSFFPFPIPEYLQADLPEIMMMEEFAKISTTDNGNGNDDDNDEHQEQDQQNDDNDDNKQSKQLLPGGNPIWGSYAYWISKQGYENLLDRLRKDVGAMLWKSKRMRVYKVKPIDKILPRHTMQAFGTHSIHISNHPAFFRAPMLTSKIHTQWDPEFCKSTEYQLQHCGSDGMDWFDLWLPTDEEDIVRHRQATGEWLTLAELSSQNRKK